MEYTGNFEVHLTLNPAGPLDRLTRWCEQRSLKFVHIELSRGQFVSQPMITWRVPDTELSAVLRAANERTSALAESGYLVTRLKIEADPANRQVPQTDAEAQALPAENYFECHVKLRRAEQADLQELSRLCCQHSAHLSRNARRRSSDGYEERFVTARHFHCGRSTSDQQLGALLTALYDARENVVEVESEYAVYDSNISLDAGWLSPQ